ncbi:hypothetical protein [Nocardiopsis sp. NRRL B-16309]|uniref:hypothetical protein n=1 Tax=Nocardiopsis sp. NRRL B-16309 TaxID=1519494 RepID=UPI0006AE4CDD|nr:hypothetical protein [Nocardiopsis sp. NRRL B-16309]KOX11959.1 hypothetical protein ADL05_22735 [Nocardiopsis sp. NRRL B-16309]
MNLTERYARLHDGIGLTIQAAEDAYRLPRHLDILLKEWVNRAWENRRLSINSCDNDLDVADAVSGLTSFGSSYLELRRELFSDLHHFRVEPPWREVGGGLTVRAPLNYFRRPHTEFALRSARPAGMSVQRVWTFFVFVSARDEDDQNRTRTHEFDITEVSDHVARVPDSLNQHGDWMEQLFYGLRTLTGNHYRLRTLASEIAQDA